MGLWGAGGVMTACQLASPLEGEADEHGDDREREDPEGSGDSTGASAHDDDSTGLGPSTSTGVETDVSVEGSTTEMSGETDDEPQGPIDEIPPGQTNDCSGDSGSVVGVVLQAECGHGTSCPAGVTGSQSGTELENDDTTIGYFEPGDWIAFDGVVMDGLTTATLRYAKAEGAGAFEFRLGSPSGAVIGSVEPTTTGGWQTWADVVVSLQATSGSQALYVVAANSDGGVANLDFIELSAGGGDPIATDDGAADAIWTNHVGYEQTGPKVAVLRGQNLGRFTVVDGGGQIRWCGDVESMSFDAWGDAGTYFTADFSGLSVEGEYRVVAGGRTSEPFEIASHRLWDATVEAVVGYFRGARASDEDIWAADEAVPLVGADRTADVRGGWYDASGDVSKYLSHLSYANFMNPQQIPLVAWALAYVHDVAPRRLEARGQVAAVEEEALWGADYLTRVLDPEGYFYITVFDGWSGNPEARQVCAFVGEGGTATGDYAAAYREGAGVAIAALARIGRWGQGGDFSADDYLAAAVRAFDHLAAVGPAYADDGQENVIDDYTALLAAAELYATTEDSRFLDAARSRSAALLARLSDEGYFIADGGSRPFWHAADAGLPTVALARYIDIEPEDGLRATARAGIAKHLDYLRNVTQEVANPFGYPRQHFVSEGALQAGFFIPHDNETEYWWQGENARLASLTAAAFIGGRALDPSDRQILGIDSAIARFGMRPLDWILGANPLDISFLNGYGRNNPADYVAAKPQVDTHVGGISNGITGMEMNGTGIQWLNGDPESPWSDWRWVEQWLPHAAWYLIATTAVHPDD